MSENKTFSELHGIHEEEVQRILAKMKHESEEQQAAGIAASVGIPYIDLNIFPIDPETLRTIPKKDAEKYELVCIQRAGKNLIIAVSNVASKILKDYLEKLEKEDGYKIKIYICSKTAFRKTLEKYRHISLVDHLEELRLTLSGKDLEEFEAKLKDVIDLKKGSLKFLLLK